eukprot:Hpha_TRINITY_DN15568_c1_g5::TRINITY_DN15568_c1_g5_i1::g.109185::m.109185
MPKVLAAVLAVLLAGGAQGKVKLGKVNVKLKGRASGPSPNANLMGLEKASGLPGIMLDVGANGGLETIAGLAAGRKVVAIECLSYAYAYLLKMFQANDNVTLLHACAGSRLEKRDLILAQDSSSLLTDAMAGLHKKQRKNRYIAGGADHESVLTVPLDSIIDEPVAYIKIDVQGFESEVIKGAMKLILKYRPVILYEWDVHFLKWAVPPVLPDDYSCIWVVGNDKLCSSSRQGDTVV